MTPLEILHTALEKEKQAYDFYDEMMRKHSSPIIKELLINLKDAEYKHQKTIEDKIATISRAAF